MKKHFCKLRFLILLVAFFSGLTGHAQLRKDTAGVSVQVGKLLMKARSFPPGNYDSVMHYAGKALSTSEKAGFMMGVAESYNMFGFVHVDEGKAYEGINYYKKGISIAAKHGLTKTHSSLLLNKGNAEEILGNYVAALGDLNQCYQLKQKINDTLGLAKCLNLIGQIYVRQGELEKAHEHFLESLHIKEQFTDTLSIANSLNNLGVLLNEMKKYREALAYFHKATQYYVTVGSHSLAATTIGNIGFTYDLMGIKDSALHFYLNAIEQIRQLSGRPFDEAVMLINTGSVYLDLKNYAEAEKYLLEGLKLAREIESKEDLREAYKYLTRLYEIKGRFDLALEMQRNYQAVSDSIINEEKASALAEMNTRFELNRSEEENRHLQEQNQLQGTLIQRNRVLTYMFGGFSLLVLITAFLGVKQTRLRARQTEMELEQKLLRSQMNPHFISNSLQSIQSYVFDKNVLEAAGYLSDFSRLIRLIFDNSFYDKIPLSREIEMLEYYLRLQELRFEGKMKATVHVAPGLDTEAVEILPMIIQPFVENAIEHGIKPKSGSGTVNISIGEKQGFVSITIEDDGIGRSASFEFQKKLEPNHISRSSSITLERMKLFNKRSKRKMQIDITDLNNPTGTRVDILFPVT